MCSLPRKRVSQFETEGGYLNTLSQVPSDKLFVLIHHGTRGLAQLCSPGHRRKLTVCRRRELSMGQHARFRSQWTPPTNDRRIHLQLSMPLEDLSHDPRLISSLAIVIRHATCLYKTTTL